jgi:hypothetical protein
MAYKNHKSCTDISPNFVHSQENIAAQSVLLGATETCAETAPKNDMTCHSRNALATATRRCSFQQHGITRHSSSINSGATACVNLKKMVDGSKYRRKQVDLWRTL